MDMVITVIKIILRGALPLFFIIFMLTEAFAFNFNINMKNGEGCVYVGGKIICRESTKEKKTSRDCMVNLWGEVVCFEKNLPNTSIEENDNDEDEDDIEEQESEPFFRIQ